MCTAITYYPKKHYFGRNLDLEYSYHEQVVITPRNYSFAFQKERKIENHYALIGMAYVQDDYPLYYDAMNEKGLSMAGLNFPENASYKEEKENVSNIAPFEFIPWILSQCATVEEAKTLLTKTNLIQANFSDDLLVSPLHWMISDQKTSIVVECVQSGLNVYDNEVGVLTNNPPFDMQLFHLNNYLHLATTQPENTFSKKLPLKTYSRGMGGLGLPGDLSSQSRFVKAAFTRMNSISKEGEIESISQFFHILESVYQQRGCVDMGNGQYEITIYSSCCNLDDGIYYYKTYENSQITAVHLFHENLESEKLICYDLIGKQQINYQN